MPSHSFGCARRAVLYLLGCLLLGQPWLGIAQASHLQEFSVLSDLYKSLTATHRPHSPAPLQFLTVGRLIGNAYRLWSRNGPLAGELHGAAA